MISDCFQIPFKKIKEEEKIRMEENLREANNILSLYFEKFGISCSRRRFFAQIIQDPDKFDICENHLKILRLAKNIEHDFLCVYSRMIFKISMQKFKNLNKSFSKDDICSVALEGFLNAFSCFSQENIRFSTYLSSAVKRHIDKFIKSSYRPEKSIDLDLYEEKFESPEISSNFSFEELHKLEGKMKNLEKIVFKEFLESKKKINLSELSKKTINPKTQKPYTKAALSLVWGEVKRKIEVYAKTA